MKTCSTAEKKLEITDPIVVNSDCMTVIFWCCTKSIYVGTVHFSLIKQDLTFFRYKN